eukprot:374712_1
MQNYKINGNDKSSFTVETGLQWGEIYKIVDKHNRIIIGGSDGTVGPGGYSMGGGHSPLSPSFGLSADWITDFYMVDANGDIVHVYNSSGSNQTLDDLFWSLRGGGGGTFGVIINITFILHKPVQGYSFTNLYCEYNFYQNP